VRAANGDDTRPACGSSKLGSYDTPLHVGALILILVLSSFCTPAANDGFCPNTEADNDGVTVCGVPLLSSRAKGRKQSKIVFICQHFGTGVLLSTAFVHLLPTAFVSLTNPCLPSFFSKRYTPLAGLIAMTAVLLVIALESYLTVRGAGHTHSHGIWDDDDLAQEEEENGLAGKLLSRGEGFAARRGMNHRPSQIPLDDIEASDGLIAGVSPLPESTPTNVPERSKQNGTNGSIAAKLHNGEDDDSDDELALDLNELDPAPAQERHPHSQHDPYALVGRPVNRQRGISTTSAPHILTPEEQQRLLLQCLLLEAGILFHSIFIGMALSVATGPPFAVFLVAIAFHQSFEGLALGSRIAAIQLPRSSPRPWLMVLAFGCTTPIGQSIGLFIHEFYDPMSQTGLLMVGFMNAISAGLLVFAGLVQLLAEDFLSEKSYRVLHGRKRLQAYGAVLGGAALMAAVGALA
jgi:solute carrier family 39 (zinc transporter), member 1/2/3